MAPILNQLRRLGASCDWSRERFTMDEGLSKAVLKVFVDLYDKDLIYRAKRLVNWDPHFETAISDLEVENIEVDGHMWHFKYPLAGGETYTYEEKDEDGNVTFSEVRDYISIATTRPETMLGDGAVAGASERRALQADHRQAGADPGRAEGTPALYPDHYRRVPGSEFRLGRGEDHPAAHDFNDYEVARRNNIPLYSLLDTKGAMRADGLPYVEAATVAQRIAEGKEEFDDAKVGALNIVPDELRGLDRFEARKRVIDAITEEGLAVMVTDAEGNAIPLVENKKIMQPFGDRSKVVIEPFLTDQWFVKADVLAKPAIASVREGRTKFVPEGWQNTYYHWMENIQPWCISRQLWWGHQIPAWYGPDGEVFVAHDEAEAGAKAEKHYGAPTELTRDEDVLDTWFSSALWPFSTLGLARQDASARHLLSDLDAGHRLRHHLLLGRPHDDDGARIHRPGTLQHRLCPRARPRREGAEDVEVQGQCRRPAQPGRYLRRRRDPVHAGGDGGAGPRHQARHGPCRGLSQLRHQDLERRALPRNERMLPG